MPPFDYEQRLHAAGLGPVAGVDEAGRGACAGPLVAAAVVLDPSQPIAGLDDSKALTSRQRAALLLEIQNKALAVSWVAIEPAECDQLGMHEADIQAMRRAVARLQVRPAYVLTDGYAVDGLGVPTLAVWKGDKVAACVSAASIVAKVTRDQIMQQLDEQYPGYGLAGHKGYATASHQRKLEELGPSAIHRWRYKNVRLAAEQHRQTGR